MTLADDRILETSIELPNGDEIYVKVFCTSRMYAKPNPNSWDSDMDYYGFDDVEIMVSPIHEDKPNELFTDSLEDSTLEELCDRYTDEFPVY